MSNVLDLIHTAETMEPAPKPDAVPPELADYSDDQDLSVGAGWSIESLGSADWALSRLGECEAESREILAQAAEAKRRIDKRADALRLKAERGIAFFKFKLLGYAETHRGALLRGSKKSHDFVHGRIGWRSKPERLVVKDEAELLAWLSAQPIELGLYRVKLEPEMKALQTLFKTQGEIPPGCDVEPSQESITITAEAPESALAKG
jgi:phage host-nuclease inhibitor protein Gam